MSIEINYFLYKLNNIKGLSIMQNFIFNTLGTNWLNDAEYTLGSFFGSEDFQNFFLDPDLSCTGLGRSGLTTAQTSPWNLEPLSTKKMWTWLYSKTLLQKVKWKWKLDIFIKSYFSFACVQSRKEMSSWLYFFDLKK